MELNKVLILDFGSQYTQLIARRVREQGVYAEIAPYNKYESYKHGASAVILSGSPFSVNDPNALQVDLEPIFNEFPVLGICYGAQYIAKEMGGKVEKSSKREYGKAILTLGDHADDPLLADIPEKTTVWMSHADSIIQIPNHFECVASTEDVEIAIYKGKEGETANPVYALQFHPEVTHSEHGATFLKNFLFNIVGLEPNWTPQSFVDETVHELKEKLGQDKVILGLSGGVDSSVAAVLLDKAIGENLHCIFVDNGLLRKDEFEQVLASYEGMGLHVRGVDAKSRFYDALEGESDPETKRKIIGRVFVEVFQEEASKLEGAKWLAQGTIYPDVIESVSIHGPSQTIKSHHNVGGLPEKLHLKIVEPLRMLFKDEVRKVGHAMEMDPLILNRHPFPGPGLGIRILGDITAEKVHMLQEADAIYINELRKTGWYDKIWQAGTILLPVKSVGVMGDERTYENTVALRAVNSLDGMTASWTHIPYDVLAKISNKIINQVKGINRVVYDISTKPPATIEWE